VLAGPVLHRLADMLAHLRPGYRERCETRTHPRGQIVWNQYIQSQLTRGAWHQLPCRFSELEQDDRLRQAIRWTLERVRGDLVTTGSADLLALTLVSKIKNLLALVNDVAARQPRRGELDLQLGGPMASDVLREGLRAMGWIVDERGLGGGRSSDGLAWALPLDQLWERYVEHLVRDEATRTRGQLRIGSAGETTVPIPWANSGMRALGHLIPDFVIYRPDEIEVVDAKYKSHFADLDGLHWSAQDEVVRESMRADIHQVLAYAATADADRPVRATLYYPVPIKHFAYLEETGQTASVAQVAAGMRTVTLCLKAAPFGIPA
jgi:5-methylcytosine-specific restriction endonuclease McrBC regulatory subunit McrC